MPTYAILGGTGNIGSELIQQLAHTENTVLHIYVRSEAKLFKAYPFLGEPDSPHMIFEGNLKDVDLITACLTGCDLVFSCVGTNANNPYVKLAEESATVLIDAQTKMRKAAPPGKSFKSPTILFVTSAGMTTDHRVRANFAGHLHWMLQRVGKYVYLDFKRAVALFQSPENKWIPVIFICAPGLMLGPSQGSARVAVDVPKKAPIYVTYTDLARAMILAGAEQEKWLHQDVGIVGAKMPPVDYGVMMYYFVTGLLCVWAPPLWRVGYRKGWWGDK